MSTLQQLIPTCLVFRGRALHLGIIHIRGVEFVLFVGVMLVGDLSFLPVPGNIRVGEGETGRIEDGTDATQTDAHVQRDQSLVLLQRGQAHSLHLV